jgi:hypothetical protein
VFLEQVKLKLDVGKPRIASGIRHEYPAIKKGRAYANEGNHLRSSDIIRLSVISRSEGNDRDPVVNQVFRAPPLL